MNNLKEIRYMAEKLRKIFVVFAIVAIAVMGMPVKPAKAVTVSPGDLIKASGPAVYYYASNGKRYVFPNEKTYRTWYADFSTVKVITDAELASIQIDGNIVYRPGTRLGKITTDPKTYAIGPHGTLHWITSESVATEMYGATWTSMIDDIPDAFFTNYKYGSDIVSAEHPDSTLIKYAGSNDIYVLEEGEKRLIADEAAFTANRFMNDYVLTIADTVTYPTAATALSVAETRFTDTAQLWGGSVVTPVGDLTVSVSSATPASFTAPLGGVGVEVAKFNFSAGNTDVALNGLTLTREGLGQITEIDRVYLYNGTSKLTSGRTLNSAHKAVFTNLGVTIPANSTVTLTVKVDIDPAIGGGSHRMAIDGVGDVDADATVGGLYPVQGNEFTVSSSVNVGKVDIESTGNYTRKVGETGVEVANFTVYVSNLENAKVDSITLYNSGRDILSNLELYRGTEMVASGVADGDYFRFDLTTPYEIAKGDSAKFTVKGDISGRNGDTATLYIRYKTDVAVTGKTYGYALNVDGTEGSNATDSYIDEAATIAGGTLQSNTITAEAGQLTAAFNGPIANDVAKNSNDVVLMNFALTTQSAVDVEKTTINIAGTNLVGGAGGDIEDLELVCNDLVVTNWSSVTVGNNSSTDVWSLDAGGVNCQVRVDITNAAAGNETIYATLLDLKNTANWVFKDANTGDTLTDIIPSGDIQGNTMSVKSATLTANVASSPAAGNIYVPNTQKAEMAGFVLTAGNAADVLITSIKVAAYLDNDADGFAAGDKNQASGAESVMSTLYLYDGDDNLIPGAVESLTVGTADVTATFSDLAWTIPAGTSVKLVVKSDISTTAPLDGTDGDTLADDDHIAIALDTIVAEYGSGVSLAPTLVGDNSTPTVYQVATTTGVLTAKIDANTPATELIASESDADMTKIKFSATNEDIYVEDFTVYNDDGTYGLGGDATLDNDNYESVLLTYVNEAGNAETASAIFTGDVASFTLADGHRILVPKDDSTVVTLKASLGTFQAADNGEAMVLGIDEQTNFRAVTAGSSKVIAAVDANGDADTVDVVLGNPMYAYESYPTFEFEPGYAGENFPSVNTKVAKLNISAHSNKDITFTEGVDSLVFSFDAVGATHLVATNAWAVDQASGDTVCTAVDTDVSGGTATFTCDFDIAGDAGATTSTYTIAKGTSKTLVLYFNTTGADINDTADSFQASLVDLGGGTDEIVWSIDEDAGAYTMDTVLLKNALYGPSLLINY